MPKLFSVRKSKNLFDIKKSKLENIFKQGLVNENLEFLAMDSYEWEGFANFVIKLNKDLKKISNVTFLILSCALVIEGVIDLIFIKMYGLDKYKKFSPFDFLREINFDRKIKIIEQIKKNYKRKRPKKNKKKEYRSHINCSSVFLKELKKKFSSTIFDDFKKIEEDINRREGIKIPNLYSTSIYYLPKIATKPDYLPDDITELLKRVDIKSLNNIRELRNIVSHNWRSEEKLTKKLNVRKSALISYVRILCLNTINNLIGLKLH